MEMELVVKAFMVTDFQMKTLNCSTMVLAGLAWLMLERILMVHSFSSQLSRPLGLMAVMLFLEKS